jgi:hypothetical protein
MTEATLTTRVISGIRIGTRPVMNCATSRAISGISGSSASTIFMIAGISGRNAGSSFITARMIAVNAGIAAIST